MNLFKSEEDRSQLKLISLDDFVPSDSPARVVDSYVDQLDLVALDFDFVINPSKGNSSYNPYTLLKIYLFGYHFNVRSSRKLEQQLYQNVLFMWIAHNLKPKHTTINDFRKKNCSKLKDIFFDFNLHCQEIGLISPSQSQDGVKLKAVNSKDKNFTFNKLDDRITRCKKEIDSYLKDYDLNDELDDLEELNSVLQEDTINRIKELKGRINNFNKIKELLEKNGVSQLSLTDSNAKLMRNNGKFEVCYNNQVMVDMHSHIVTNFSASDNPSDHGSLNNISKETKEVYNLDIITDTTDKGYNNRDDMMHCLEDGIIPEVTPLKGQDEFVLETDFEENSITDDMIKSSNPDDLKKCLHAGIIPDVYKDKISNIEVVDKKVYIDSNESVENQLSKDELRDIAMRDNCFTRDLKENVVFCPEGETLRQKSTNSNKIRYCNKLACKNCKNPCCASKYKTVDFAKNQTVVNKAKKRSSNRKTKIVKKVIFHLKPNFELLKNRMATSEHPHGSMKFWDNSRYLLLKGKRKVNGEIALYYTSYNIRRAINIKGASFLIDYFKDKPIKNPTVNVNNLQNEDKNIDNSTLFGTISKSFLSFYIFFKKKLSD